MCVLKITLPGFFIALLFANNTKLAAQTTAAKTSSFDSAAAISEINAQNKIFMTALAASDSLNVANIYTHDARIFNTGMPVTNGRTEIISFYGGLIRYGITKFACTTTTVSGNDNNLVIEEGTLSFAVNSGEPAIKGRYLLVWKREDGRLRIFRDTFFSNPK